ncbi:hypothetical protein KJS94_09410 [Flavihumibacter rivuli]|uniref:hypothetical protein n=1 Tax=Flavihumibacter rivuli TaxID=2838156 RepID=UPI001BDE2BE4|nr:hypothetical protein [Flavihumibacter rivuli]ULQ58412.1 hypothetical protein KJS94_09410 [Flavihumibacter rivuli]
MNRSVLVASIATAFAVIYNFLHLQGASLGLLLFLFALSPFVMGWLVITVLKDKSVKVRELEEGEEWGYTDREK